MELTIAILIGIVAVAFAIYTTKKSTTQAVTNKVTEAHGKAFNEIVETPFFAQFSVVVPTLDVNGVQLTDGAGNLKFHRELPVQYQSVASNFENFKAHLLK